MTPSEFIPLNPRDYLILFALADDELHGYGIVKDVDRLSGGQVRLDPANLYRALKRLLGSGLVEDAGRLSAPDVDDERRRYYRITKTGREVVRLEAARLAELTAAARARRLIPGRNAR